MERFTESRIQKITDTDVTFIAALRYFFVTGWAYAVATLIIALTIAMPIIGIYAIVRALR